MVHLRILIASLLSALKAKKYGKFKMSSEVYFAVVVVLVAAMVVFGPALSDPAADILQVLVSGYVGYAAHGLTGSGGNSDSDRLQ